MSSELQELIHRSTMLAFEQGVGAERDRIVKLLQAEEERLYLKERDVEASITVGKIVSMLKESE